MDNLQHLMDKISDWSDEEFGDHDRIQEQIDHFKTEVEELNEAFGRGYQDEEDKKVGMRGALADCWMMLLDITSHTEISMAEMSCAIWDKLKKNRK